MQLPSVSEPTVAEYFPAAQSMQFPSASEPTVAEYLPASQSMQAAYSRCPFYILAPKWLTNLLQSFNWEEPHAPIRFLHVRNQMPLSTDRR